MQGSRWTSANAVPVSGFGVHQAETLAGCKETAGPLQMLCVSADLVCIKLKRWLGTILILISGQYVDGFEAGCSHILEMDKLHHPIHS